MVEVEAMLSVVTVVVVTPPQTAAAASRAQAGSASEIRAAAVWETSAHLAMAAQRFPSAAVVAAAVTVAAERVHNSPAADWAPSTEAAGAAAALARPARPFRLTQRAPRIRLLAGMDQY
jgi:hypothetical protein